MDRQSHWEQVYRTKASTDVSWYQATPRRSLQLLDAVGAGPGTAVIDVGGGDSTLVDALLDRGIRDVTVLDISRAALDRAAARLGERAASVAWIAADVTTAELPASAYDVWHDRAVFHFLVAEEDRRRYRAAVDRALRPGGHLLLATFAPDGPVRCSGLEVARWSPEGLEEEFGGEYALVAGGYDEHRTPGGAVQRFAWAALRRGPARA
jgi:SAM-dependent methyltransferase